MSQRYRDYISCVGCSLLKNAQAHNWKLRMSRFDHLNNISCAIIMGIFGIGFVNPHCPDKPGSSQPPGTQNGVLESYPKPRVQGLCRATSDLCHRLVLGSKCYLNEGKRVAVTKCKVRQAQTMVL